MQNQTDLKQVKRVSKILLFTEIHNTDLSPMIVQHPFTSTGITLVSLNPNQILDITKSQDNLEKWRNFMLNEFERAKNITDIYKLVNKPYCLTFLKFALPYLSSEDFSRLLADAWIRSENPNMDPNIKIENKKLVIDERTAPIVRKAFSMYAAGQSVADICRVLNGAGYRTKTGAEFNKNSFTSMFRNKKYIGQYKFMDIVIDNGVPAIIDEDTFNKVQERLNRRADAPARGKALVDYMLSGKLICGHCNEVMTGTASTSHTGRKYFYYTCAGSRGERKNGCTKSPMRKEWLEKVVVQDTLELLTPQMIEHIADIAIQAAEKEKAEKTAIPTIENEIADIEKTITRLLKLVENGADSPTLAQRLNELEKDRRNAERRLAKEKAAVIQLDKPQVIYFLTEFTKGNVDDPKFQRRIIDLLVNSVVVWDDDENPGTFKFTITYNLTPKKTKTITVKDLSKTGCVFHPDNSTITSEYAPYILWGKVFAINVKHRFE